MTRWLIALALSVPASTPGADPWRFSDPVDVVPVQSGVFHHLESSGRRSIAVSGDSIAITWEDNRSGAPQVYVAMKGAGEPNFGAPRQLSTGSEAYEPAIIALEPDRFVIAWEQDGDVWTRTGSRAALDPPLRLASGGARQVALARDPKSRQVLVAWAQRAGRYARIRHSELTPGNPGEPPQATPARVVDPEPPEAEQAYPAVAVTGDASVIVWEDRRHGHTVLLFSHGTAGRGFSLPRFLNEQTPRRQSRYGKGLGVMRVSLAASEDNRVVAAWLDKREFVSGYDVYAAFSDDGGRHFGANQRVQDDFGGSAAQWHAALATTEDGQAAIAWSDARDGNADIWLSWPANGGWSDDLAVPGASGAGIQTSPALGFDGRGNLHLAWIERAGENGPTRVRYAAGRKSADAGGRARP